MTETNIDALVRPFVENYEFRGDSDYTPNDDEKALLEDALHGFISDHRLGRLASQSLATDEEVRRLREHLGAIVTKMDTGRDAPGHSHQVPGIWDDDASNGENAGKPCEWCAQWDRAKTALQSKDTPSHGG